MGTVTGRCVIWGAAPVGPSMLELLRPGDHIIAADGGWVTARSLGVQPHCILGDFDSAPRPDDPDAIVLPTVKDDTDTQYATRLALEDGYTDILYLGVLGGKRLDHTLAALQTALGAARQGAKVMLADENTEIHSLPLLRLEHRLIHVPQTAAHVLLPGDSLTHGGEHRLHVHVLPQHTGQAGIQRVHLARQQQLDRHQQYKDGAAGHQLGQPPPVLGAQRLAFPADRLPGSAPLFPIPGSVLCGDGTNPPSGLP